MGGLFSLEELTSLVSIGTLLAFTFVSFGVILLRRRKDIPEGDFKVPFYPVIPILSGLACIGMMCFYLLKLIFLLVFGSYLDYLFTVSMDINIVKSAKEMLNYKRVVTREF